MRFEPAYLQLDAPQRAFVDEIVKRAERESDIRHERITEWIRRDLPGDIVERAPHGMLANRMIAAAVHERVMEIAATRDQSPAAWAREVQHIAHSSMDWFFDEGEDGIPVFNWNKSTDAQRKVVKKITIDPSKYDALGNMVKGKIVIEFYDKMAALVIEGKYMGVVEPDNPHWASARPTTPGIAADATVQDAADAYQRRLEAQG